MDNAKIEKIASHYGLEHQIGKAKEELQELYVALLNYQLDESKAYQKAVITELADVTIMVEQLRLLMDVDEEVETEIEYKLNRQLRRMEKEKQRT